MDNKQEDDSKGLEKELNKTKILIAVAEDELLWLFSTYLSSLGMDSEIASSREKTLDCFFGSMKRNSPYNTIVLDTHLSDHSGLDTAKKIRTMKPDQKLVIVTTTPKEYLSTDCLKTAGIEDKDILTMPFKLSMLAAVLKN